MARPETIEDVEDEIRSFGGWARAVRVDHSDPAEVAQVVARIADEQQGRIDVVVNGVWGGDQLTDWEHPFWEQPVAQGLRLLHQAVDTHVITTAAVAPLLLGRGRGLILELTDGLADVPYRGSLYYDLAKTSVSRLALGTGTELGQHGVSVVALAPGFLRSEAMLDKFGVTEQTWRDGIARDPYFAVSESPVLVARCAVALAADPDPARFNGTTTASWLLAVEYGLTDADGTRPDWGGYFAAAERGDQPDPAAYRVAAS